MTTRGRRQCDAVCGCGKFYSHEITDNCPHCGTPETFSHFMSFNPLDWIYDLECYPNVFTASFKHANTGTRLLFEISDRRNELEQLVWFLQMLSQSDCRMVGFNNVGYDYPILHFIIENFSCGIGLEDIFTKSQSIIDTPWENRFDNLIAPWDVHIQQIDLFKIHHFDNKSRRTSLKLLEFNMRSQNIQDLPYTPGTYLTHDEIANLILYNDHDVDETEKFYIRSLEMIRFREKLSEKYDRNFLNHSDKKVGNDYFIMELERMLPGSCYEIENGYYVKDDGRKVVRQTRRDSISLNEVILPYINFKRHEFTQIKEWLAAQTIYETKGVFAGLHTVVNGFQYDFGVGGIHGSIESTTVYSDDDYVIYDWDVTGYYPSLAIANNLHPNHLGDEFCGIYQDICNQRLDYAKGTPENAMFKLAANGVYGDSNSDYSPFHDPQYTMSITINGQLLLCLLAENLIDIPHLKMIQANTDGLTVLCPRKYVDHMKAVCEWWEQFTCLNLESAIYNRMFIRDVNNYIAEYDDGKVKRKGTYEYELDWHQNHSALIVPKAAETALLHGTDITTFITGHTDIMDFMLRTKVGRADKLVMTQKGVEQQLQNITRYYIGKKGGALTKISPPTKGYTVGQWKRANKLTDQFYNSVLDELKSLSPPPPVELDALGVPWDERINTKNRSKYEIRRTNFNVGRVVAPCNDIRDAEWSNIDFDYYINETHKLVDCLNA